MTSAQIEPAEFNAHKQDEPDSLPSRLKLSRQKTTSKLEIQAHLLDRRIMKNPISLLDATSHLNYPTVSSLYLFVNTSL
jgi:hypothetical protein